MSAVGVSGVFLSLLAWLVTSERGTPARLYLFLVLLALLAAASTAYYFYVQTAPADTSTYYFDRMGLVQWDFRLGTVFLVKLVQTMRDWIGGTYLDYFLLFQAIGFWGIVLLMRTLEEVHDKLRLKPTALSYLLLFLPGVHFWTSAIGKDAPLFLGCSLVVWAAMRIPARLPYFATGVALMVLFRPHIALVAVGALAMAEFFDPRSTALRRLGLMMVALAGLAIVAGTVESTFRVDVTSAESLSTFIERQQAIGQGIGGTTAVVGASYPVKLLSLLFRPFFFDSSGAFAMVASMENVVYVFIIGFLVLNVPLVIRLCTRIYFLRFCLIFAGTLILLLSLVYYNVGLGARQKTMFVPGLFSLVAAVWAVRRSGLDRGPTQVRAPQTTAPLPALGQQKHA